MLTGNRCAPLSFELIDCAERTANTTDILSVKVSSVEVAFGSALDCEEKPCYPDLDDVDTPPTPPRFFEQRKCSLGDECIFTHHTPAAPAAAPEAEPKAKAKAKACGNTAIQAAKGSSPLNP